jgi:hypothetical protein
MNCVQLLDHKYLQFPVCCITGGEETLYRLMFCVNKNSFIILWHDAYNSESWNHTNITEVSITIVEFTSLWHLARLNRELPLHCEFVVLHTCVTAAVLGNRYWNDLCRNKTELFYKNKLIKYKLNLYKYMQFFFQRESVTFWLQGIHHCHNIQRQFCVKHLSGDSVDSLATGYGLDHWGVRVRVPVGSRIFSSPSHPDRLRDPPNLLSNGYQGLFPWG